MSIAAYEKVARAALKACHGNVDRTVASLCKTLRANPSLLEALVRDSLKHLDEASPPLQPDQPARSDKPKVAMTPAEGSVRVKTYTVPPTIRRTAEEKAIARAHLASLAEALFDRRINGKRIGDLRWRELRAMAKELTIAGVSYLRHGTDSIENAILMHLMNDHVQVVDDSKRVKEILTAAQLKDLCERARRAAPRLIAQEMHNLGNEIENVSNKTELLS